MNLKFWKRKKAPEESDDGAANETLFATETAPIPAKPGFWTRLKSALSPSRRKIKPDEAEEPKHTGKKHRNEEPEPSDVPADKSGKNLVIVLALLAPLVAAGGFFAASKLLSPPQRQKAPPTKDAASKEAGNATTSAAEVPAPADKDIQTQIEALKKQNQEMQAQIEALKKQPAAERPAKSTASATPREGVLVINGKNARESAQGLKSVIEEMNAASRKNAGQQK